MIKANSEDVGERFEEARKIHYMRGRCARDHRQTTPDEAQALLLDEGTRSRRFPVLPDDVH